MKKSAKKTGIMSALLLMPMTILILVACNWSKPIPDDGGRDYPIPSPEEEAVMSLSDTLHTRVGLTLTGAQLAVMTYGVDDYPDTFGVNLPVTDLDERPAEGVVYTNAESGGTIVFHYGPGLDDESIDSVGAIGTVDLRTVIHSWESADCLPDSANKRSVQARGNSIYTPYHTVHHRSYKINDVTYPARWSPEYYGCLIYVYPGADSLVVTFGYEESKRIYKR